MEGLSKINYKGKEIIYIEYGGTKEQTLQLVRAWEEEFKKHPPKSVLAIVNTKNLQFDKEILNAIKDAGDRTVSNQKKTALLGVKPIIKAAYNFVFALTFKDTQKTFDTEEEAKEWLVKD